MLEYETREDRWRRQTKEQFEALGRFVAAFESLVDTVRNQIPYMVGAVGHEASRVAIILHHDVMSAKPLFDVLRATTSNRLRTDDPPLPKEEQKIVEELLANVGARYKSLAEKRNALLHGTWFIGWATSDAPDFSEFEVMKWKVTAEGMKISSEVEAVKGVEDLNKLRFECEALENIFFGLSVSIITHLESQLPSKVFYKDGKNYMSRRKVQRGPTDEPEA